MQRMNSNGRARRARWIGTVHGIDRAKLGKRMIEFPRLAVATPATGPEPSLATLALLAGLTQRRWRVQHFRTRACPTATEAVGQVTGLPERHLDAWLMPPALCRGLFARAARSAELAVVEGTLDKPVSPRMFTSCDCPGDLRPIAEALDLPVVAVVSCRQSNTDAFHLPRLPEGVDAVLLDELGDPAELPRLKRMIRLAASLPVIGAIEAMPAVRDALEKAPRDRRLPDELIEALSQGFWKHANGEAIAELARSRPFPESADLARPEESRRRCRRFRVAYAQDEAFGRYFPDTLESLEALGAELVEFSPLRDERLPDWRRPGHDRLRSSRPPCRPSGIEHEYDRRVARTCLPRQTNLFRRGRDRLPGTAHGDRGPPLPGCGHSAVRRRALARSQTARSRHARAAARLLARTRGNGRPGLQERPLAVDSQRRAARVPRLLRCTLGRGRLVLPSSRGRQSSPPSPGRIARSCRCIRRAPFAVAEAPIVVATIQLEVELHRVRRRTPTTAELVDRRCSPVRDLLTAARLTRFAFRARGCSPGAHYYAAEASARGAAISMRHGDGSD